MAPKHSVNLMASRALPHPHILSQKTTMWVRHNLHLVNPSSLFPVTFLHAQKGVHLKDLTHNCPQEWREYDQLEGPQIILWVCLEDKCNTCLCDVIRHITTPPRHHYDTASSAPLGAARQVPRTHMAQILSIPRSLFICFRLPLPLWTLSWTEGPGRPHRWRVRHKKKHWIPHTSLCQPSLTQPHHSALSLFSLLLLMWK